MKFKAVIFDIDDTLFPSTEFAEKARKNAVNAMVEAGLNADEHEAYAQLRKIIEKVGSNYDAHFDDLCEFYKNRKNRAKIIAAGIAAYHNTKSSIRPYPSAARTLLKLRDDGCKIYIASEGIEVKQWDKLFRLGLYLLVDEVFVTAEKNAAFYRGMLKKLKLKGSECLMVGDRVDKDVEPAKQAGIRTALLMHQFRKQEGKIKADFRIKKIDEVLKIVR
ncbi:Glyceraldehyde 3-phosphate phosphatase [Candidatus Gugararchaeum adminiculabundum]|nr:Glyceraldehyde 3-phosphate phosphatase [Candidatus Gugararchaeum adminiculabundum]